MRHAVYLAQVRHGNGLAADGVVGDAGEDQRYVFGADALDELFELLDVHVALEGVLLISAALGYLIEQRLVVEVAWDGTHLLDVALGSVEVAVGGDGEHLAGCRAERMLRTISMSTDSAARPCWMMKVLGRSICAAPPLKRPPSYSQR